MANQGQDDAQEEVVRPMFWTGYTGAARKRSVKGRATAKELKAAYSNLVHEMGELTFDEKRELFPYIFWPPVQNWCIAPFDMQSCPKGLRAGNGTLNPLVYGWGPLRSNESIWKQAVLAVFQSQRRYYQIFEHILIPIHYAWADEDSPDDVPMWGLVHYQKGADTAYVHVMTEWHTLTFSGNNARWANNLAQSLTSEDGVDDNLFLGDNPRVKIQWVSNRTGEDWDVLGARGESTLQVSDMSYLYIIYAAMKLAVQGCQDTALPEFGGDDAIRSLAQALVGVSTALEHAEEGGIQSVKDGIKDPVRQDATDEQQGYREMIEEHIDEVVNQDQQPPDPKQIGGLGLRLKGGLLS